MPRSRGIEARQLAHHQPPRPPVTDDVVCSQYQQVVIRLQTQQLRPEQGAAFQLECGFHGSALERGDFLLARRTRQSGKVTMIKVQFKGFANAQRLAIGAKSGAQGIV